MFSHGCMMMPAWCPPFVSVLLCSLTCCNITIQGRKKAVYVHVCVEWDSVKDLVLVELLENENPRSRPFKLGHKETFSK